MHFKRNLSVFILVFILMGILCGCGEVKLTDEQQGQIETICKSVDIWGESFYDSGRDWPINRIYLSENSSGVLILTVGYKEPSGSGQLGSGASVASYTYFAHDFAITDQCERVSTSKTNISNWSLNGLEIDLTGMSTEEINATIERAYRNYLNRK